MVDFGATLKRLRLEAGYTQQQLADRLGVTKSVVSYYELHERVPSPEILVKLSTIFRVSTDYLLGLERGETVSLAGLEKDDIITIKRMVESLSRKK